MKRCINSLLAALVVSFFIAAPGFADTLADRNAAFARRHFTEEIELLHQAAERGDVQAQFSVAMLYSKGGKGVPYDPGRAAKWFHAAAEQDHVEAKWHLGLAYSGGKGVPEDYTEAAKWMRAAAEQGHDKAQAAIGNYYRIARGVPRNYIEAYKWFSLAAAQGNRFGKQQVRNHGRKMTPEQLAEAQRMAREWKPKK